MSITIHNEAIRNKDWKYFARNSKGTLVAIRMCAEVNNISVQEANILVENYLSGMMEGE
jgi:hypothetical protein